MTHRNLASERVRIGLTQEQMAKELGIAASTLVRYEQGGVVPPSILSAAADKFGCTVDYLLDRTEERMPRV